ncbi:hypothetical protein CANINC_001328 [Pichia inconspicua]|uniref:Uncharacterized protein n=1 Tax=Pichia inconspicua TaxID=52247 RepID=A0A4T0X4B8_9ASCO|nr:hypothetical protein CANINC_001328 [[Candida] inconspicua]
MMNDVLKFLSINNNVIPALNTGNVITNNIAVNNTDHTNKGNLLIVIPNVLILNIVVMKFMAPNNDDIDVKCKANIAKSTDGPECDCIPDNGGYTVHPVPAPFSIKALDTKLINAGGNNQKLMLFKRANDISLAPIINGTK